MDAGAEDVLEPEADEDEDNDKEEEKYACFPACALSDGNGFSFNLPSVDVSSRLLVIVGSCWVHVQFGRYCFWISKEISDN
jgi:hypothetical protein